jgi:single-strand DNA-binding protein
MAMSLNRAQLIGNVTRDPEVRQIPGGTTVASFSIATNFVWKDQSGAKQEKAEFHNITAWRNLADICGQYIRKGSKVYVEGRIQTRDWEGEDGVKRYRTEIVADNIIMLDRKGAGPSEGGAAYTGEQSAHAGIERQQSKSGDAPSETPVAAGPTEEVGIDDLPF